MIIFIYGEDTLRSRQKCHELKEKFIADVDPGGSNLSMLDGSKSELGKIIEIISASSLFSRKRMVIIENLFDHKDQKIFEQIRDYFQKNSNTENIIIFWDEDIDEKKLSKSRQSWFKFLIGQKYAQNFKKLSNTETITWIKQEVQKRKGKISGQAATILSTLLQGNLWQISNEIDKLISYKISGTQKNLIDNTIPDSPTVDQIEANDVEKMVKGAIVSNIFALTDAIGSKNKSQTLKLLEQELESGVSDIQILSMIMRQFRILLQVRQAIDDGMSSRKIISILKLQPFIVHKAITQVRNFSLSSLKNILNYLIGLEKAAKSGRGDIKTILSLMAAKL